MPPGGRARGRPPFCHPQPWTRAGRHLHRLGPRQPVANDRLRHMLVRHDTPNGSTTVVVWYDVAPDVTAWLVGLCVVGTSRIWFARMDVALGLRARLPRWPLSPTSDRPAIVITPSH